MPETCGHTYPHRPHDYFSKQLPAFSVTKTCPGVNVKMADRIETLNDQFERWSERGKAGHHDRPFVEFSSKDGNAISAKVYYVTQVTRFYGRGPNECYPDEQEHLIGTFPVSSRAKFHQMVRQVHKLERMYDREEARSAKAEAAYYDQMSREMEEERKNLCPPCKVATERS